MLFIVNDLPLMVNIMNVLAMYKFNGHTTNAVLIVKHTPNTEIAEALSSFLLR